MATLEQIRNLVARKSKDVSFTALSVSDIDAEINRAIRTYQNQQFWFNEDKSDITLTANNQVVPSIPSDLVTELEVNGLTLIDDQVNISLVKIPTNTFVELDQDQTGRPLYYTFRDGEYLLLPIPEQAYTLEFRYLKVYTDLVNDGDTNDFTDNAQDLIMLSALARIYAEDKEDTERGIYYKSLEMEQLKTLQKRNSQRLSTGTLTINSIIGDNNDYIWRN